MADTLGTIKTGTGAGSGLDIEGIVSQLVEAEGSYESAKLDSQEAETLAKITGFGNLKSALSEFNSTLDILRTPSRFQTKKTQITNDSSTDPTTTYFTATASGSAASTSYSIEVEQLATAHKLGSAVFATSSAVLGTGTLQITVGAGEANQATYDIVIGESDNTISGIQGAINERTASTGVSATLVTSDAGVQLVLTSNELGSKHQLEVSVLGDSDGNDTDNFGLSQLTYTTDVQNMTETVAAQDANVRIDGQFITVSSNSLVDTIDGISIELLKAEDGKVHTVSISSDVNATKEKIVSFVDAYNDFMDITDELTAFDQTDTSQNGDLFGDVTVRNIQYSIRRGLGTIINDSTGFNSLASLGITTNASSGQLEIDDAKLTNALSTNIDSVVNLMTDSTNGVATNLYDTVNKFTKATGILDLTNQSLNSNLQRIALEKLELTEELTRLEVDLTIKFASLDALLGQLQSTSNALSESLDSLVEPLAFKK